MAVTMHEDLDDHDHDHDRDSDRARRLDGFDRIDAPPPLPVKGVPGGWLDWFDEVGRETLRIRDEVREWERQRDELIAAWQAERRAGQGIRRG